MKSSLQMFFKIFWLQKNHLHVIKSVISFKLTLFGNATDLMKDSTSLIRQEIK
jgi:hypothetical protein